MTANFSHFLEPDARDHRKGEIDIRMFIKTRLVVRRLGEEPSSCEQVSLASL